MLRTAIAPKQSMVRLYDSHPCRGHARVGVRPGTLFPLLKKAWEEMMPNGTADLVQLKKGDATQVLRMSYGPWEVLVVDAGGQELTVPADADNAHNNPLLAVYLVARRTSVPSQATHHDLNREEAALRERLEGRSVVFPAIHSPGFTRVIQTQLTADFERIADPERTGT